MRRLVIIVLVLIALVIAAAAILPAIVPADTWRGRLETAASNALGREVSIDGDIVFALLPRIQARAENVTIANPAGFGDAAFAEMGEMRFALALLPLIQRDFVIEEFVLVEPVIRLEERQGRNNWTFSSDEAEAEPANAGGFRQPGALPIEASLGDVRIVDGTLIYLGEAGDYRLDAVDLAIALPGVDEAFTLTGQVSLEGQRLDLDAELGSLRGFFEGARVPATVSVRGPAGGISFDGEILESTDLEFQGQADVDLSLPQFAALFGSELAEGDVFQTFSANGQLRGVPGEVVFTGANLALDAIAANGDLRFAYDRPTPLLDAALTIPVLDLNPYLPEAEADQSPAGAPTEWSDAPLDLSVLSLFDAELDAEVGELRFNDVVVTDAQLDATLSNGRLSATLPGFGLYGGRGSASLVANSRGTVPSYSFQGRLETLQAQPFLDAAAGFDRLRGIGTLTLDVTGSGESPAAIMNGLQGEGQFDFAEGAIVGVNLARVIRGVLTAVENRELPQGFGDTEETDFSALRGSFAIRDGVVLNQDLTMLSPLLRVGGQGEIDLGGLNLDYRLTPRAVASLTGQGGEAELEGIAVPVIISGSFSDPRVTLDFAAIARALVEARARGELGDLGDLLDLDRVRENGAAGLLDILTGAGSAGAGAAGPDESVSGEAGTETAEPAEEPTDRERAESLIRGFLGAARDNQSDTETETSEENPNR
ncbi:AsmA family protein [Marinicauda pacifica]|uniref:AsmA family protein n=1 Tax=Marinicauda pacifica TaxID=1133559 RepID=UPI0035C7E728